MAVRADFDAYIKKQRREIRADSWLSAHLADPNNYSVLVHTADPVWGQAVEVAFMPILNLEEDQEFRGGGLHCVVSLPALERLVCAPMK